MSRAALALQLSQPTVARRVTALEDSLGVTLIERGVNAIRLSEAGAAVLEAASGMAEGASAAVQTAEAYRMDVGASVRITATASVTLFLSQHAPELSRAAAPHQIAFLPTRRKLNLATGEADIALRMRSLPEEPDLFVRRIALIAFALYARSDDPTAPVIAPPEDPHLSMQAAYLERLRGQRPVAARIGDMPMRRQAILAGLGAGVLPCWLGDSDPDLIRISPPGDVWSEDLFLVTHHLARRRPVIGTIADALAALFKAQAALLAGEARTRPAAP
ncbi:LysR family transcriptional regulator [Alsobacter sp. KACC 23698]